MIVDVKSTNQFSVLLNNTYLTHINVLVAWNILRGMNIAARLYEKLLPNQRYDAVKLKNAPIFHQEHMKSWLLFSFCRKPHCFPKLFIAFWYLANNSFIYFSHWEIRVRNFLHTKSAQIWLLKKMMKRFLPFIHLLKDTVKAHFRFIILFFLAAEKGCQLHITLLNPGLCTYVGLEKKMDNRYD